MNFEGDGLQCSFGGGNIRARPGSDFHVLCGSHHTILCIFLRRLGDSITVPTTITAVVALAIAAPTTIVIVRRTPRVP
jgi:hypothetical protein